MDNGHEISAPERKFIQTEPLYYGHSTPLVAFLFLHLFFSTFSFERLSLRTAGFSVRSKHFSKRSMSLCGPVKIYSHGIYRLL